jgi:hypothetical protein
MKLALLLIVCVMAIQVAIFIYSRRYKKKQKEADILSRYNISSRSDLFGVLNRNDIPEEDLEKLNAIYSKED